MTCSISASVRGSVPSSERMFSWLKTRILQQVGGSFGAAVLTVILELQLTGPGTATRLATGFDRTFWWAIGFTVIGALPAMLLRRPEPPKPAGSGK
jgi:hypothetical protein